MKNVVNIVNFVRAVEPRNPNWDPCETLKNEIAFNKAFDVPNTILLQYDALLHDGIMSLCESTKNDKTEFGVWVEIVKPLVERCGIKWRGRPGFAWDWHVNPGFLMAYTKQEKFRILDELFRLFKEKFGYYPKSVGSWLLDSDSMHYLQTLYDVDAFAICREQWGTDGYSLWGGYYNGLYYPSKNNMLNAAQSEDMRIKAPLIRLLGIDPTYCYYEKTADHLNGMDNTLYTLEPAWVCGQSREWVDWYFATMFERKDGIAYTQVGQENSFEWSWIRKGLAYQMEKITRLQREGRCEIITMGETGRRFKKEYADTPVSTMSALDDWTGRGFQSVWYNCRRFRFNLFCDAENVYIRDLFAFTDKLRDEYLDTPCETEDCLYEALPVIDGLRHASDTVRKPGLYLGKGKIVSGTEADGVLHTVCDIEGKTVTVTVNEHGFTVSGVMPRFVYGEPCKDIVSRDENGIRFEHRGVAYRLDITSGNDQYTYTVNA